MTKSAILFAALIFCISNSFAQNNWVQRGSDIDGENSWDHFGTCVSMTMDGSTIAIGASQNDQKGADAGHVRVYTWRGGNWIQKGVDLDGKAAGDRFGTSVSISEDGNTVAIGAQGKYKSHVRVFTWKDTVWRQKGLDMVEEAIGDEYGFSISMSSDGNTVAVGAPRNDEAGEDAGHVRVYRWLGEAWRPKGEDLDGEAVGDYSGFNVSMSADGNTLAIGAIFNDGSGQDAGHVRIYSWSGLKWIQRGADIDGEEVKDRSGWSVSMSSDGNAVAIGAWGNDSKGTHTGQTRVYTWSGSAWTQKGSDIDGDNQRDRFGWCVSLSSDGNTLAVGAVASNGNGKDAGQVKIYSWNGKSWAQKGQAIYGESSGDQFGWSISISADGSTVAIGSELNDGTGKDAGHVRVFGY